MLWGRVCVRRVRSLIIILPTRKADYNWISVSAANFLCVHLLALSVPVGVLLTLVDGAH